MKKTLSVLLFLSGLMPVFLGLTCLISISTALDALKLSNSSPDMIQAITLFGICLIPGGITQLLAAYWTWTDKSYGIVLSRFVGLTLLLNGVLMYFVLHRTDLAVPDFAKGILITALAFWLPVKNEAKS